MRIRFLALLILLALASAVSGVVRADAAPQDDTVRTLRITRYADNVNQVCPDGSQKLFMITAKVQRDSLGSFADGDHGVGEIVLRSDRQLNSDDYLVPPEFRQVEFYFFPQWRGARVKKDPTENSVTVELAGPNMVLRLGKLRSDCVEEFGEE